MDVLDQFYVKYLEWVDSGAAPHGVFRRDMGLCGALYYFLRITVPQVERMKYRHDLVSAFEQEGLDPSYPFNTESDYYEEGWAHSCHLNSYRIAWVRKQVSKLHLL